MTKERLQDKPDYIKSNIELYHGDCLGVMDKLIAKGVVVDAIITDPPNIDYPKAL